jgi:hypothetical protein
VAPPRLSPDWDPKKWKLRAGKPRVLMVNMNRADVPLIHASGCPALHVTASTTELPNLDLAGETLLQALWQRTKQRVESGGEDAIGFCQRCIIERA